MPTKFERFSKAMERVIKIANDYKKDADSEAGEKAKLEKARDALADAAIERDDDIRREDNQYVEDVRDSSNVPYRTVRHFRKIKKINETYDEAVQKEQEAEKAYSKFLKDKADDLIELQKAIAEMQQALSDYVSSLR